MSSMAAFVLLNGETRTDCETDLGMPAESGTGVGPSVGCGGVVLCWA